MSTDFSQSPEIDLGDIDDARVLGIGRVPANSRVLDLGLADGSVARSLRKMGCRVWGVTTDADAAEAARDVFEKVVQVDLNSLDINLLEDQKFDVILMFDVLENLTDPTALLLALPQVLDDGGWAVISLLNVAHASIRLGFLRGRFTYPEAKPNDRTRLRLFDRQAVDGLLQKTGWQIFDRARVIRTLDLSELDLEGVDPELVGQLESDMEALTHQFVLAVAPVGSPVLTRPPMLPAAAAQSALFDAVNRIRELEQEVRQRDKLCLPDLIDQLDEIRDKAIDRMEKLKDIRVAIRES